MESSRASEDLGAIDFVDDQDIDAYIEEVMLIDKEAKFEELPMDKPSLDVKALSHQHSSTPSLMKKNQSR